MNGLHLQITFVTFMSAPKVLTLHLWLSGSAQRSLLVSTVLICTQCVVLNPSLVSDDLMC